MATHGFYLALAYGASAAVLVVEVLVLCLRWRKLRHAPTLTTREGDSV